MDERELKRKTAFIAGSIHSFSQMEDDLSGLTDSEHQGNWVATQLAACIIGLNMIDVICEYEDIYDIENDLTEIEHEAALLSTIHEASLMAAVDLYSKTLPLIGTSGADFKDALDELEDEFKDAVFGDAHDDKDEDDDVRIGWDDVPPEVLQMIADEAGISVDELCRDYSFKAVNMDNGRPIGKEDLRKMNAENTMWGGTAGIRARAGKGDDTRHEIEDQESALDDFMKGLE